jgi:hypothetical protein
MITVEEHQKTLSAKGINLPKAEVQKLLDVQYKLANVFFDLFFLKDKTKEKVVVSGVVHTHKINGNVATVEIFAFSYSYDLK